MKEGEFFQSAKTDVEQKKKATSTKPLTLAEHEDAATKPMDIKDHWLSLRQSIQEKIKIEAEPESQDEKERTKLISELITPELLNEYKEILKDFRAKSGKSAEHPDREFIEVDEGEFAELIENWIENLIVEVKTKREIEFDENDIEELKAQCWMLFESIGSVMNTKTLEKDIVEFYQAKNFSELDDKNKQKQSADLVKDLQTRYPLSEIEVKILLDLIKSEKIDEENYSPQILVETIARLWGEYKLNEKKGALTKISLGYLMSKGAESFAPSLWQNIMPQGDFNYPVFLEYFGLEILAGVIEAKNDVELAKVMNEINQQINTRITNSLFFQEFEFIHEKSLGEIYATLERGKNSTEQILKNTISRFAPILAGIVMSLAFLTKINPVLGAIGIGSLPIMYKIAKKQNEKIGPIYERENQEGEKIATRLGAVKSGFEEIKTSPETPSIASHVKDQLDTRDKLSLQRFIEETKMRLLSKIPFNTATVVAAGTGAAFQEAGLISGGAVFSTIMYSNHLNRPIAELVELYFDSFARNIQDIQRMEEILGSYEQLDLPEGEKEKDRVPISELENFDISVNNLCYKNILRNVNIDIKQGEFLTITGASGAGKSTFLRSLVGLYKADSGDIKIGGVKNEQIKKYGPDSIYAAMSYCNQGPQVFDGMTLRENLLLWSKADVADEKIKTILRDLHLDQFVDQLDKELKHLSGGEKVRIGVARTLIKGAKIMLLDEPTASLDSQAATEVRKIIGEISNKYPETTIICVSHDEELAKISQRSVNITELQQ